MNKPFKTAMHWGRQAFLKIKAWEDALEYRFEDYALERLNRLEERVAAMERKAAK